MLPVMGVSRNPIEGVRKPTPVPIGATLLELSRKVKAQGPLVCELNGQEVERLTPAQWELVDEDETRLRDLALRADNWGLIRVREGDFVEWKVGHPQDREVVRVALQVASLVVAFAFPAAAPYLAVLNFAYNVILPPKAPKQADAAEGVYSASLSGNLPRLNDPIPKVMGRVMWTPPLAAIPYQYYSPKEGEANPDHNRDQRFNAIFCLGIDETNTEKVKVGNTSLVHFQGIVVSQDLPPGTAPSVVKANIYTCSEINDSELYSEEVDDVFSARYVGPFAAVPPGDRAVRIEVDVEAHQGLGKTDADGDSSSRTAAAQFEVGEIDDYGRPVSEPSIVGTPSWTDDTNTPQRWTESYNVDPAIRPEVRGVRTDIKGRTANIRDGIHWTGLRAELARPAPLSPYAQHYEVSMLGDQLSPTSRGNFQVISRALVRTWDEEDGWSADRVESRNPFLWALDFLREAKFDERSPRWGMNEPDSRIDIATFVELADVADLRQDRIDFVVTERGEAWEVLTLILRCGRAKPFRRNGVISCARDALVEAPVRAYTPHNTEPGSIVIVENPQKREFFDGVIAQFLSNVTGKVESIECPGPGRRPSGEWGSLPPHSDYDSNLEPMANPSVIFYAGITGRYHAEREGLYDAYDGAYRRTIARASVELEGSIVAFLDPCLLLPEYPGYGQSGVVLEWDSDLLVMTLSEPPDWDTGPLYLTLQRDDGSLTTAVEVMPWISPDQIVLPELPDFEIVVNDGRRESPKYALGHPTTGHEIAKVIDRTPRREEDGTLWFDLDFLVDSELVHRADNHLLPGPGDIQDPIDSGTDYPEEGGGGFATLVRLQQHAVIGGNVGIPDDTYRGGLAQFDLFSDGTAGYYVELDATGSPATDSDLYPGEWLNTAPVDPAVAALYEVQAIDTDPTSTALYTGAGAIFTGTLGTWQALSSDRSWSLFADDAVSVALFGPESISVVLQVSIRKAGLILRTRTIALTVALGSSPP